MSEEKSNLPRRADETSKFMNWFEEFSRHFQLAWKLLADARVSLATKLIPLLTLIYVISPIDLLPDVALGLGQLDDLAVVLIGLRLFVNLCPPLVVDEHKAALKQQDEEALLQTGGPIIDVEPEMPAEESPNVNVPGESTIIDLEPE